MDYLFTTQLRENARLRDGFFALARSTFDLSFAPWHQAGWWTDRYIPYAFALDGQIVANASANIIDTVWQGEPRRYIQIGTVMTAPSHRNRGLSRLLIEKILADWQECSAGIYLYANDSVLDFYPKFGFVRTQEQRCQLMLSPLPGDFRPLDMSSAQDVALFRRCYERSNPFSALPMNDNFGLVMFYCGSFMRDCVSYSPSLDLACVSEQNGTTLLCHDLFGRAACSLEEALAMRAAPGTTSVQLGFTPKDARGAVWLPNDDDAMFILPGKGDLFSHAPAMFPTLSHA